MTEKLFTVAGTAAQNGTTKVRFANDLVSRIKILVKNNCEDINLVELPRPMTKLEALQHLRTLPEFQTGDAAYAVGNKIAEKSKIAKRSQVKVTVPTTFAVESGIAQVTVEPA